MTNKTIWHNKIGFNAILCWLMHCYNYFNNPHIFFNKNCNLFYKWFILHKCLFCVGSIPTFHLGFFISVFQIYKNEIFLLENIPTELSFVFWLWCMVKIILRLFYILLFIEMERLLEIVFLQYNIGKRERERVREWKGNG